MTDYAIFIPARLESQRLPKKALQLIGGKPMVVHVVERAKETNCETVIVATDSMEICSALKGENTNCLMTSKEHQTGTDRVYEALQKLDPEKRIKLVLNLQGDMPFINPSHLKDLIDRANESTADILTLASKIEQKDIVKIGSKSVTKAVISFYDDTNRFGRAIYFSREAVPYQATTYYEHIGVYLYRRSALEKFVNFSRTPLEKSESLEQLRALEHGLKIDVLIVDGAAPISVDVQDDLDKARAEHARMLEKV